MNARRLHESGKPVALRFEGRDVAAVAGETVAVALYASGEAVLSRSIKYHRPRSFFCLAGHCGACLMRIDGEPNRKACRTPVREQMVVERQNAFPSGGFDILGAADFLFARGMDHHTLMTSPRSLNQLMQRVVRQLGGLGRLPERAVALEALPQAQVRRVDVVVVGGGPAGLAAATTCAQAGRTTLLVDEQDRVGGSYLSHPDFGLPAAQTAQEEAIASGVDILSDSTAIGWYPEDEGPLSPPGLLAVHTPQGLLKVTADRYLYATGAYDQNALFANNDRPGIFAARAVGRLLVRFGVLPAKRPVVVGGGPYATALTAALTAAGAAVTCVDGTQERLVAAHGHTWIRSIEVATSDGKKRRYPCDLVAVAALPAPASELLRQHGATVAYRPADGGFVCMVDRSQRTSAPSVFAAGDVCGVVGPKAAAEAGARGGLAILDGWEGRES